MRLPVVISLRYQGAKQEANQLVRQWGTDAETDGQAGLGDSDLLRVFGTCRGKNSHLSGEKHNSLESEVQTRHSADTLEMCGSGHPLHEKQRVYWAPPPRPRRALGRLVSGLYFNGSVPWSLATLRHLSVARGQQHSWGRVRNKSLFDQGQVQDRGYFTAAGPWEPHAIQLLTSSKPQLKM